MDVDIKLLGGFEVTVDGVRTPDDAWTRRHAAGLVLVQLGLVDQSGIVYQRGHMLPVSIDHRRGPVAALCGQLHRLAGRFCLPP